MNTDPRAICKYNRTTQQQIKHYIQFCKEHPDISRYQLERYEKIAPKHVQDLWTQLVDQLNEIRGPVRTIKKWKESLSHWRNQVRSRSRKHKAQYGSDVINSHYEDLLKFVDLPGPELHECPEGEHQPHVINEAQSDIEFPFDSIFLPSDGLLESSSSSSRSLTPVSDVSGDGVTHPPVKKFKSNISAKAQRSNFAGICGALVKSLEARREREEVLLIHQQSVITKLDNTLVTMNQVLEKINDKLDRM